MILQTLIYFFELDNHGTTQTSSVKDNAGGLMPASEVPTTATKSTGSSDSELGLKEQLSLQNGITESALAQLLGVAILEVRYISLRSDF
jgi:hypothetical protein